MLRQDVNAEGIESVMRGRFAVLMGCMAMFLSGCEVSGVQEPEELGSIEASLEFWDNGTAGAMCPGAHTLECGVEYTIHHPFPGGGSINRYQCWTPNGLKAFAKQLKGPETVLVPNAPPGTWFFLHVLTPNTTIQAFQLHGSCDPIAGTKQVKAYDPLVGMDGTCADTNPIGVSGVAGEDFAVLDSVDNQTDIVVRMNCQAPAGPSSPAVSSE